MDDEIIKANYRAAALSNKELAARLRSMIHNVTEGLGIAAPVAEGKSRPGLQRLLLLALVGCEAALAGFEAQPDAIEQALGELVGSGFTAERALDQLGNSWEITRNYFRQGRQADMPGKQFAQRIGHRSR